MVCFYWGPVLCTQFIEELYKNIHKEYVKNIQLFNTYFKTMMHMLTKHPVDVGYCSCLLNIKPNCFQRRRRCCTYCHNYVIT